MPVVATHAAAGLGHSVGHFAAVGPAVAVVAEQLQLVAGGRGEPAVELAAVAAVAEHAIELPAAEPSWHCAELVVLAAES